MKITIEGTKSELETAKLALESVCFFDSDHCKLEFNCEECIKQNLEITYVQKQEFAER